MRTIRNWFPGALFALLLPTLSAPAYACGGFFCSTAQPVNQAAERIVFADNGDGTVTAVIQIQYQGPAESFSWLLPIATAPTDDQIKVASDLAFTRLQSATNPQYTLTTRVEGQCAAITPSQNAGGVPGAFPASSAAAPPQSGPVTVEASGAVGPFEWTVISVEEGTAEPADQAVLWLMDNGYDVPDGASALLGPYLQDGLFLLALRLTKQADVGSIRPIVLTYEADRPIIPIKLTAVAANEDMGVMTWLLGPGRGVPENYLSLELNEARIDWFNANNNYNAVVSEAADDAGGQGFVTEFAGDSSDFASVVWSDSEEQFWQTQQDRVFASFDELFNEVFNTWGSYDGFWDGVQAGITLDASVPFEDFKLCPSCYAGQVQFSPSELMAAIEENVIGPMRIVQDLIDAQPTLTRLYSTLSAPEMTLDPLFTFNAELPDVNNIHTAERVIECGSGLLQFEAPWRIELPQGGVIRGVGQNALSQPWPEALSALPPNFNIQRQAASGSGRMLEDNSAAITEALDEYNAAFPPSGDTDPAPTTSPTAPVASTPTTSSNTPGTGGAPSDTGPDPAVAGPGNDADDDADEAAESGGSGCAVSGPAAPSKSSHAWLLSVIALACWARRGRRA